MNKTVIIMGSSRSNGNTYKACKIVCDKLQGIDFINLADYEINDFCYENKFANDDFHKLIINIIKNYHTIILATPIYWYTMSAPMKRFLDRTTDLLKYYKDLGRLLRGKNLAVITSYGEHPQGKDGFEPIFKNTANYLGMNYLGCYFHFSGDDISATEDNNKNLRDFCSNLENNNCLVN